MMEATHDCGMCDGVLTFDGMDGPYPTYRCIGCGWWHIAKDCCEKEAT